MSAHMTNINNVTNSTNNQDRQDPSEGDVGRVAPEDQATLRHSASSTESTTSSSISRPMSSADHVRALAPDQGDESASHPDEGLILRSERVSAAHSGGGIFHTRLSYMKGLLRTMDRPWSRPSWLTHKLVLPAMLTT